MSPTIVENAPKNNEVVAPIAHIEHSQSAPLIPAPVIDLLLELAAKKRAKLASTPSHVVEVRE